MRKKNLNVLSGFANDFAAGAHHLGGLGLGSTMSA